MTCSLASPVASGDREALREEGFASAFEVSRNLAPSATTTRPYGLRSDTLSFSRDATTLRSQRISGIRTASAQTAMAAWSATHPDCSPRTSTTPILRAAWAA